ncbi:MAG: hypothetical protein AAGG44_12530 [Planctomycetota bacterium]
MNTRIELSVLILFVCTFTAGCKNETVQKNASENAVLSLPANEARAATIQAMNFGWLSYDSEEQELRFRRPRYEIREEVVEQTIEKYRTETKVMQRVNESGQAYEEEVIVRVPYQETVSRTIPYYVVQGEQTLVCKASSAKVIDVAGNLIPANQLAQKAHAKWPAVLAESDTNRYYLSFLHPEIHIIESDEWTEKYVPSESLDASFP